MTSEQYGRVDVRLLRNRAGLENIIFSWTGGDRCLVSEELVREGGPYLRGNLFSSALHIGPYRLNVLQFEHEDRWFVCQRDPKSLHNRIVPHVYPLYVRWVEFWRWVGSKDFRRWLFGKGD